MMPTNQNLLTNRLSTLVGEGNLRKALDLLQLYFQVTPGAERDLNLTVALLAQLSEITIQEALGADMSVYKNKLCLAILSLKDKVDKSAQIPTPRRDIQDVSPKKGKLLHDIPKALEVGKKEVCTVRIGENTAQVKFNFKGTPSEIITLPEIGRRMSVTLDAVNSEAFEIQAKSRYEQKLPKGVSAEWLFYIRPLMAGHHKLLIIVDVVEDMDGESSAQHSFVHEVDSVTYPSVALPDRTFQEVCAINPPGLKAPAPDRNKLGAAFTLGLLILLAFIASPLAPSIPQMLQWITGKQKEQGQESAAAKHFMAKGIAPTDICKLVIDRRDTFPTQRDPKDSTSFYVNLGSNLKNYTDPLQVHDFQLLTPKYMCEAQSHKWPLLFNCLITPGTGIPTLVKPVMGSTASSPLNDTICHITITYNKPMQTEKLSMGKVAITNFTLLPKEEGVGLKLRINDQNKIIIKGQGKNQKDEKCTCETPPFKADNDSIAVKATVKCVAKNKEDSGKEEEKSTSKITLTLDKRWLQYFDDLEIEFDAKMHKTQPNAKGELVFSGLKPGNHKLCVQFQGGKNSGKALALDCFGDDIRQDIRLILNENGKIIHEHRINRPKQ